MTFSLANDHYVGTNGIEHFYFKQTVDNVIDIDNANINVNEVAGDGTIFSYGHSLYSGQLPSSAALMKRDFVGPVAALTQVVGTLGLSIELSSAKAKLANSDVVLEDAPKISSTSEPTPFRGTYVIEGTDGAHQSPKARLVYLRSDHQLDLVWRVETDVLDTWTLSYVDATKADTVLGVVDYAAHSRYFVYPWGQTNPAEGPRVVETDPTDLDSSPLTWHEASTAGLDTHGNNAIAQSNFNNNQDITDDYRPVAINGDFFYRLNFSTNRPSDYINASVTQLFYTANMMHDLLYTLGFNEQAGNFQEVNGVKGGVQGDAVILNSQTGGPLMNNAYFQTPTDGASPRMNMYLWGNVRSGQPLRDPSFDSDIVIHEYTHGLSNRLTGGPANSKCLQTVEASGLGEGWSDFFAIAINLSPNTTRSTSRALGAWAQNSVRGIRAVPYTSDTEINPGTYQSINNVTQIHSLGTVWCTILHELLWNLIDVYGINRARKPSFVSSSLGVSIPSDGRYLAMKLVMDGMALQPCNPNFVDARDSILDADRVLTGGANLCLMWKAFASRGLGVSVSSSDANIGLSGEPVSRTNSFDIPEACK